MIDGDGRLPQHLWLRLDAVTVTSCLVLRLCASRRRKITLYHSGIFLQLCACGRKNNRRCLFEFWGSYAVTFKILVLSSRTNFLSNIRSEQNCKCFKSALNKKHSYSDGHLTSSHCALFQCFPIVNSISCGAYVLNVIGS